MYNVEISAKTNENQAIELIFNACRSNEGRKDWKNAEGFAVTFKIRADGDYEAALRNPEGEVIAIAVVDKFDC